MFGWMFIAMSRISGPWPGHPRLSAARKDRPAVKGKSAGYRRMGEGCNATVTLGSISPVQLRRQVTAGSAAKNQQANRVRCRLE